MNFDLTKEISLDRKNQKTYRIIQILIYFSAVLSGLYLAYLIIFPTEYYLFMFSSPNSTKNNIIDPRNSQSMYLDKGYSAAKEDLFFDAAIFGNYSQAKIIFLLNKKSQTVENNMMEIRKSHQAFFYPEGKSLGFKNGTLVKTQEDYYLISEEKARKFSGPEAIISLGFNQESFREISSADLAYNEKGEDISDKSGYPDGSIFKIKDEYYQLEDQRLKKFISPGAYASHYDASQAIEKDENFLKNYPLDEAIIGFSDGTPISYGISAYIASRGKIHPVNNPITFSSMGYNWEDVIAASGDEISMYEKEKLFTLDSPHPEGTVMVTRENSRWYRIESGQKRPLPTENIARSWLKINPILVAEESLALRENCRLNRDGKIGGYPAYSCLVPIEKFEHLPGKTYEFKFASSNDIDLEEIRINFEMSVTGKNFKNTVNNLMKQVKNNYVPEDTVTIQ